MREDGDPRATSEPREQARLLVERGAAAYENGEYETALASFQDAAATYASPDLHFNMGLCHERLGEYAAALRSFEAYLRNKPDAPDRASVEHRIELLGELASREDEAVAASRPASVPSVELPTIEVPFPREGSPAAGTPASPSRTDASRAKRRPGRAAIATGATLLGAGTALAVGGGVAFDRLARRRADRVENVVESGNPESLTLAETSELAREADRYRGLQIGSIVVGAVLVAVGIGLVVVGQRRARTEIPRARTAWLRYAVEAAP